MKKYRVPSYAITERGLRRLLKDAAKDHSSFSAWGQDHGITPQTISSFMRKVQGAGLQIPAALGYRPQIVYIPLDEDLISTPNPPRRPTNRPTSKVDHTREPIEKRHMKRVNERKETRERLKKRLGKKRA